MAPPSISLLDLTDELRERIARLDELGQTLPAQALSEYASVKAAFAEEAPGHSLDALLAQATKNLLALARTSYDRIAPKIRVITRSSWGLDRDALLSHFGDEAIASESFVKELVTLSALTEFDTALSLLREARDERQDVKRLRRGVDPRKAWRPSDVKDAIDKFQKIQQDRPGKKRKHAEDSACEDVLEIETAEQLPTPVTESAASTDQRRSMKFSGSTGAASTIGPLLPFSVTDGQSKNRPPPQHNILSTIQEAVNENTIHSDEAEVDGEDIEHGRRASQRASLTTGLGFATFDPILDDSQIGFDFGETMFGEEESRNFDTKVKECSQINYRNPSVINMDAANDYSSLPSTPLPPHDRQSINNLRQITKPISALPPKNDPEILRGAFLLSNFAAAEGHTLRVASHLERDVTSERRKLGSPMQVEFHPKDVATEVSELAKEFQAIKPVKDTTREEFGAGHRVEAEMQSPREPPSKKLMLGHQYHMAPHHTKNDPSVDLRLGYEFPPAPQPLEIGTSMKPHHFQPVSQLSEGAVIQLGQQASTLEMGQPGLSKSADHVYEQSVHFTHLHSPRRRSLEDTGPTSDVQGALSTLQPGKWVSSTAIERVLSIFKVKDIRVLDSTYVRIKDTKRFLERRKPLQFSPTEHSIIVVLDHLGHWTTAAIDLQTGSMDHFDSLRDITEEYTLEARNSLELFRDWLLNHNEKLWHITWTFRPRACLVQTDAFNCGIYSLVHCICALAMRSPPAKINCNVWRMILAASIAGLDTPAFTVPDDWAMFISRLIETGQLENLKEGDVEGSDFNQGSFLQRQLAWRDHVDAVITSRLKAFVLDAANAKVALSTAIGASDLIRPFRASAQQMYEGVTAEVSRLEESRAYYQAISEHIDNDVPSVRSGLEGELAKTQAELDRAVQRLTREQKQLEKSVGGLTKAIIVAEKLELDCRVALSTAKKTKDQLSVWISAPQSTVDRHEECKKLLDQV